nr:MAG TPA: Regulatory protein-modification, helix-turn-helix, transcriptional regulator, DNA [Caudoviricetes sp.]
MEVKSYLKSADYYQTNRTISALIKKLLEMNDISEKDFAELIDMNYSTFRSKLSRDSFTAAETIKILDLCGYKFSITSK